MQVNIETINPTTKRIQIEIPAENISEKFSKIEKTFSKQANIKGFRQGKVPHSIVASRFKDHIKEEVRTSIMSEAIPKILKDHSIDIVSTPEVIWEHDVQDGSPYTFTMTVEVHPVLPELTYKNLAIKIAQPETTLEEDTQKTINQLLESSSKLIETTEERAIKDGDYVEVAVSTENETKPSNETIHMDKTIIPKTLYDGLLGTKKGVTKQITLPYGDNKEEKTSITVMGIKYKEIPELTDEFAAKLGNYKTSAELKDTIIKNLTSERETIRKNKIRAELINTMVTNHPFDLPEGMVKRQTELSIQDAFKNIKRFNKTITDAQLSEFTKDKHGQFEEKAKKDIRWYFILEKIMTTETISATDEDVSREIERMAGIYRTDVAKMRADLEKQNLLTSVTSRLEEDKVIERLISWSTIQEA